jgi:hypothetical protein
MIADDKKAMETNTVARSPILKRSDTNSFPKGFPLRYLIITKNKNAVKAEINKYIKTSKIFILDQFFDGHLNQDEQRFRTEKR